MAVVAPKVRLRVKPIPKIALCVRVNIVYPLAVVVGRTRAGRVWGGEKRPFQELNVKCGRSRTPIGVRTVSEMTRAAGTGWVTAGWGPARVQQPVFRRLGLLPAATARVVAQPVLH